MLNSIFPSNSIPDLKQAKQHVKLALLLWPGALSLTLAFALTTNVLAERKPSTLTCMHQQLHLTFASFIILLWHASNPSTLAHFLNIHACSSFLLSLLSPYAPLFFFLILLCFAFLFLALSPLSSLCSPHLIFLPSSPSYLRRIKEGGSGT